MAVCQLDEAPVAKKTTGDQPYEAPTETVRLPKETVQAAREVCLHTRIGGKKLKLTDYLDGLVKDQVMSDLAAIRARLLTDQSGGKKKPGKEG